MEPQTDPALQRIDELRAELLGLVEDALSPVARRYGYSEVPLETNIKWRPLVLILGNYSSGKSTLINELLGLQVQETGQAPTDDSFTVLTFDEETKGPVRVTEERDGKVLLNDPQYPFLGLKRHGQRFASHFRLKLTNSPFLRHLALIDTPGMLDSIAEKDRGYDYQEVIGDLAQIADLVLVLFDPHKAGTVREAHASLRDTLPARTFEDRVVFVMNRIDECESLNDLLRVYGTLCWNLSQMLGRKDIPQIRLTYSASAGKGPKPEYLKFLANQREELKRQISEAPRYRLDHLAAYAEMHGERLGHLLEALLSYERRRSLFKLKANLVAAFFAALLAAGIGFALFLQGATGGSPEMSAAAGALAFALLYGVALLVIVPRLVTTLHRRLLGDVDSLTDLDLQSRRDTWAHVRPLVVRQLERTAGKLSGREVRAELDAVCRVLKKGAKEIREALNRLPSPV
jgi:energy-coupling factor transporter ATP-binding protein EcfA2